MVLFHEFQRTFDGSFWRTLKDSIVPFAPGELPAQKQDFLRVLHADIASRRYAASSPRDYIVQHKHRHVPRIVPAFSHRDACVYFFCVKHIEDEIAVDRVPGTFGGWRLGNPLRTIEEEEVRREQDDLFGEYTPTVSYDRFAWTSQWQEFQKRAFQASRSGEYQCFIKFDIANFYDSVNLRILEEKLRSAVGSTKRDILALLLEFLATWNRRFEGYARKTVGLPADEIGDCSRLLANFYLQEYDRRIADVCATEGARYLRYTDDQLVCARSAASARRILVEASKFLFKLNLSVNSAKVDLFESTEAFDAYWAFDLFSYVQNPDDREGVNKAASTYVQWRSEGRRFRDTSVLKRLLAVGVQKVESAVRYKLLAELHGREFLVSADHWRMSKVYSASPDRDEFVDLLHGLVGDVDFNAFHFNLLRFYSKSKVAKPTDEIHRRIEHLRIPDGGV